MFCLVFESLISKSKFIKMFLLLFLILLNLRRLITTKIIIIETIVGIV